jgi:phosphate:Na+ symporter
VLNATAVELPRQIANAHTLGNLIVAVVLLPFLNKIAAVIDKMIKPDPEEESLTFRTKYLKEDLNLPPSLALTVIKQEVIHMAHIVQEMVNRFLTPFIYNEKPDTAWIQKKENEVDYLRDRINAYLIKITGHNMEKGRFNEAFEILYTVKEFEKIADFVYTIYMEKTPAWREKNLEFSEEGKKELGEYHIQVQKQITRAIEVFRDLNLEKAKLMKEKHRIYRQMAMELEKNHYLRLVNAVEKSIKTSEIHLELMTILATIHSHATNVARIVLEWTNTE